MTENVLLTFLQSITEDIETVDGGCCVCVGALIDGLNEQLQGYLLVHFLECL